MRNIKWILMLGLMFAFCITSTSFAKDIEVEVNEKNVTFDVVPQIMSGRTMIPLRATLESLGAEVEWDNKTKVATGTTDKYTIYVTINSTKVLRKDNYTGKQEEFIMDVAPVILNERTLVPVRFIAESLNKAVIWNGTEKRVIIIDIDYVLSKLKTATPNLYEFITKVLNGEIQQDINKGDYTFTSSIEVEQEGKIYKFEIKFDISINIKDTNLELHMKADPKSYKASLGTIIEMMQSKDQLDDINAEDIQVDLYYDGTRYYISSPLLKNEQILTELGINHAAKNGIVVNVDDKLKKEINEMISSFSNGNIGELKDSLNILLSGIDSVEELQNLNHAIDMFKIIFSNSNFKKTTDGYSFAFKDLKQIKNSSSITDPTFKTYFESCKNATISSNYKIKDNNLTSLNSTYEFSFENLLDVIKKLTIKITAKESKDNSYTFEMPSLIGVLDYDKYVLEK